MEASGRSGPAGPHGDVAVGGGVGGGHVEQRSAGVHGHVRSSRTGDLEHDGVGRAGFGADDRSQLRIKQPFGNDRCEGCAGRVARRRSATEVGGLIVCRGTRRRPAPSLTTTRFGAGAVAYEVEVRRSGAVGVPHGHTVTYPSPVGLGGGHVQHDRRHVVRTRVAPAPVTCNVTVAPGPGLALS